MHRALAARLRAVGYRGYTKLPRSWQWSGVTAGMQALTEHGAVRIEGGLTEGLRFAATTMPLRHIQAHGWVRGSLEPTVQEALGRTLTTGSVFYDVGANVGFFSLVAARLVGTDGAAHAFEPVPGNLAGLRTNASLNGLAIDAHDVAVSDYIGRSSMSLPREASWSHLTDLGAHPQAAGTLEVAVTTLDAFARSHQPPDVIKIDVEGYELEVLKGAAWVLRTVRPAIVCELHGTRNAAVVALLQEAGYAVSNLDGPEPAEAAGPTHILATPR